MRADLADRTIFEALQAIPEKDRKASQQLMAEFERERPKILSALLEAVSCGLRRLPNVHLERLPRMADFAKWATACEPDGKREPSRGLTTSTGPKPWRR
jgi:hypothetical protein